MNKCCYIWSHAKITAWYTSAYHSSTLQAKALEYGIVHSVVH